MSIVIKIHVQGDVYAEYVWDKYEPHYWVYVGKVGGQKEELVRILWKKSYGTVEQAKRSYQRQVRKIKKGEIV